LAEVRTSDTSSCGERAELSSSAGSMPNRSSTQLATAFVSLINGVTAAEKSTCGPATTLAVGGDRQSSRTMWRQLRENADSDWIRSSAERRLLQLDAMDAIDQLNAIAERYAAREGRVAQSWQALVQGERLRGIPLDPAGAPHDLAADPAVQAALQYLRDRSLGSTQVALAGTP
jgi:hypothetical protein